MTGLTIVGVDISSHAFDAVVIAPGAEPRRHRRTLPGKTMLDRLRGAGEAADWLLRWTGSDWLEPDLVVVEIPAGYGRSLAPFYGACWAAIPHGTAALGLYPAEWRSIIGVTKHHGKGKAAGHARIRELYPSLGDEWNEHALDALGLATAAGMKAIQGAAA